MRASLIGVCCAWVSLGGHFKSNRINLKQKKQDSLQQVIYQSAQAEIVPSETTRNLLHNFHRLIATNFF